MGLLNRFNVIFTVYLWHLLSGPSGRPHAGVAGVEIGAVAAPADEECDLLIYRSLDPLAIPEIVPDEEDTCPRGGGRRAFVAHRDVGAATRHDHFHGGEPHQRVREVRPTPGQHFHCLNDGRRCFIVIRGFGLQEGDALAVQPFGVTGCPPDDFAPAAGGAELPTRGSAADSAAAGFESPIIVQCLAHASLARSQSSASSGDGDGPSAPFPALDPPSLRERVGASLSAFLTRPLEDARSAAAAAPRAFEDAPIPPMSFSAFEVPERAALRDGRHTLCYAPYLANRHAELEAYAAADFHYFAGTVTLTDSIFDCDFERREAGAGGDSAPLPCGFRNYRDRYQADISWRIAGGGGGGASSRSGTNTAPSGDATEGLGGGGRFLQMDNPGYALGAAATVVSGPLALPTGTYCADFAYFMNGADVSTLRVYMHEVQLAVADFWQRASGARGGASVGASGGAAGLNANILGEWGAPKWVAVGNKGPAWHRGGFEFRTVQQPKVIQLVFEAVAGRSEYGSTALDDVRVRPGRCAAAVRHHLPKTLGGGGRRGGDGGLVCGEVRLNTGTHPSDKSWFVDGAVSCSGRGYSLEHATGAWLPCCVPHFGTYKLVLQDHYGDGWTGSSLEFRFFDRVFAFGNDSFASGGFDRAYDLTIGTLEIVRVEKPTASRFRVVVRAVHAGSFVWCGVAQASARSGQPLKLGLTPAVLKRYGVRSAAPTAAQNELVTVPILNELKPNAEYDVYCYGEVVDPRAAAGGGAGGSPGASAAAGVADASSAAGSGADAALEEISASRLRVSTDNEPPRLSHLRVDASYHSLAVSFAVDEPATVWCAAVEKAGAGADAAAADPFAAANPFASEEAEPSGEASPGGEGGGADAAAGRAGAPAAAAAAMWRFFETGGVALDVSVPRNSQEQHTLEIGGLVPNAQYYVYCYAEDNALPEPNRQSIAAVLAGRLLTHTRRKVPSVRIARKSVVPRGFKLWVRADAAGAAICAAAPAAYGTPGVEAVVRHGARAEIRDPRQEVALDLYGVDENTVYVLYCVGEGGGGAAGPAGGLPAFAAENYSDAVEMLENSVTATSYGRYCEQPADTELYSIAREKSLFQPITAVEEMRIRSFILKQPELALEGVYRINALPNKTEIYAFLAGEGPRPRRYARVRAGRCEGDVGFYEQFCVGPIDGKQPLGYARIAQPVETACAGYNPQGVFGRRRRRRLAAGAAAPIAGITLAELPAFEHVLSPWFRAAFGFPFATDACEAQFVGAFAGGEPERAGGADAAAPAADCLVLGPIVLEDACDAACAAGAGAATAAGAGAAAAGAGAVPGAADAAPAPAAGTLWVGLKLPSTGDQVPFFFRFSLESSAAQRDGESAPAWAERLIAQKALDADFYASWPISGFLVDGRMYGSVGALVAAIEGGELGHLSPAAVRKRRRLQEADLRQRAEEEYLGRGAGNGSGAPGRRLGPDPFAGAPGTAGPVPRRSARRRGLEYRSHPEHVEAQGKRFTVVASEDEEVYTIQYAGWEMTVVNDRDTSLRLFNVRFQDQRVAFELGLMEALAHYTVSERNFFFMDSWYGGLGAAARRVHKGIECPKTALSLFWDGSLCVFEQDLARPVRAHWKSGEIRDGSPHTVLVLRQMLTVSNYDYLTDYVFHLTGMMEGSVSFTGELYAGVEVPWYSSRQADYGVQVTGAMRLGALHAHLAVWKIDFDVGDYRANSVQLTEVVPDAARFGANKLTKRFAEREREAAWFRNDTRKALTYEVVDETYRIFGNFGGYRLHPGQGADPLQHDYELYSGPGAWAKYRAFSTVFKYSELDATLPRDNKYPKRPAVSVDRYIADDEPLRKTDVVTWVSSSVFHVPVVEDMPLTIPVGNTLSWLAKPANLFHEDPSMDLHNAMGGGVDDPGTCAVVRVDVQDVEPSLANAWTRVGPATPRRRANALLQPPGGAL